jgi:hypothetical protein
MRGEEAYVRKRPFPSPAVRMIARSDVSATLRANGHDAGTLRVTAPEKLPRSILAVMSQCDERVAFPAGAPVAKAAATSPNATAALRALTPIGVECFCISTLRSSMPSGELEQPLGPG